MKPLTVTQDVLEPIGTISVSLRLRNVWRLKLGCALLRLAAAVLRTDIGIVEAAEKE